MPKTSKVPTVRFNFKNGYKEGSTQEDLVVLFFRYKGQRLKYSTGEKVINKYWIPERGRAKNVKNHPEYAGVNENLTKLEQITIEVFKKYNYGDISISDFKREIDYRSGKAKRPEEIEALKIPTFLEFATEYVHQEKAKINATRGTWKKLEGVLNHLKDYANEKSVELSYDDINWQFKNDFEQWLYSPPRSHAVNNAAKIFQVVKQFLAVSYRQDTPYHNNMLFQDRGFNIKRVKVKNKGRLTFNEIDKLMELDLSDHQRLERVRDLFVFGCYTGLRFSDWHKITRKNVKRDATGKQKKYIEVMNEKTKKVVKIPLLPRTEAILEKYDYSLPSISSQNFNKYIKEVCELAISESTYLRVYSESGEIIDEIIEKHKMITSHWARRSFATNFWEKTKRPKPLMRITGHSTQKQFFEYIDIDDNESMDELDDMF